MAKKIIEKKEFEEEVIKIDRVTKVVKGGKKMKFRVLVVVGDKKGKVGIGIGKANEVPLAIQKAIQRAKKDIFEVPLKGSTIPYETKIKEGSGYVYLAPAIPGTGIVAGKVIRAIVEKAGINDIITKSLGSANALSVAKATMEGLRSIRAFHNLNILKRNAREAVHESKESAEITTEKGGTT